MAKLPASKAKALAKVNGHDPIAVQAVEEVLPDLPVEQLVFVARYAMHMNGARAVREAKIETGAERWKAHELLTDPNIQAHISAVRARMGALHFDLQNQILSEFRAMSLADVTEIYNADGELKDPKDWPEDVKMLIVGVEVEERMQGEGDSAELIRTKKVKLESRKAIRDSMVRMIGGFHDSVDMKSGGKAIDTRPVINITVGVVNKGNGHA